MNNLFWQAPGNAKGFDSFIGDNSKMNNRTIGILEYINSKLDDDMSMAVGKWSWQGRGIPW